MFTKADKEIGILIKKRRERLGVSQVQLAKELGFNSPVFISLVESGKSKLPIDKAAWFSNRLEIPKSKMRKLLVKAAIQKIDMNL